MLSLQFWNHFVEMLLFLFFNDLGERLILCNIFKENLQTEDFSQICV